MFKPQYVYMEEALSIVAERTNLKAGRTNPLLLALYESAILAEVWRNPGDGWVRLNEDDWANRVAAVSEVLDLDPTLGPAAGAWVTSSEYGVPPLVRFAMCDIDRLWSDGAAPTPAPDQETARVPDVGNATGKGGRPTKYDWAAAGGFIAGYIAENDYPEVQADLEKALKKWFGKRGGSPDKRDIERFVAEAYKQRPGKP